MRAPAAGPSSTALAPAGGTPDHERDDEAAGTERERRGDQPSSRTRMERKRPDVYRSGVKRYKPRAPRAERDRRLISKRFRRAATAAATQIGPRLYEMMVEIATRCASERRGEG